MVQCLRLQNVSRTNVSIFFINRVLNCPLVYNIFDERMITLCVLVGLTFYRYRICDNGRFIYFHRFLLCPVMLDYQLYIRLFTQFVTGSIKS